MRALLYILITSVKNRLLELIRKPAKLALYLICIVGIGALIVLPLITNPQSTAQMDIIWLKGFYFIFVAFFFVIAVQKGLSNGDMIFEMQDVNLLFVSPISPKSILLYGLAQMIKMAFIAGFFILFQSSSIGNLFGKGFGSVLILLFCFILVVVVLSITSLVIYNFANGQTRRKRLVRILSVALFVPLLAYAVMQWAQTGDVMVAVEQTLYSPVLSWTPVVGWGTETAMAFIAGDMGGGALFTAMNVLAGGLIISYILLGNIDYYEDVLVATETAFERKRALSEGQVNPEALSTNKTRVKKTGVGGFGASTLLYKHLRETTRTKTLGFLTWPTVFLVLGAALIAFFMRGDGAIIMILQILMWAQVFMIGVGRGLKELSTHYIYLIPESSFYKILWSNLEPVAGVLLQSILLFGLSGWIAGEPLIVILGCIMVFTTFSMMLIGINYLSMRWFGTELGNGILIMIYMISVIVIILPGLITAVIVSFTVGGIWGTTAGLGILALWELIAALICFALSQGVLHRCDIMVYSK